MALSTAQRYQLNLLGVPDGSLADADLYALAGVVQAESSAPVSLTTAQRYQLNLLGVPDGSITVGDRYALAGVVETAVSAGPIKQVFSVSWNIGPTWSKVLSTNEGYFNLQMAPFTFSGLGSFSHVTNQPVVTWGMRLTMQPTNVFFSTRIHDQISGVTRFGGFKAAKTWIVDKLFFRTVVSTETTAIMCRCVRLQDTTCFSTKINDYIAAKVRTPGVN